MPVRIGTESSRWPVLRGESLEEVAQAALRRKRADQLVIWYKRGPAGFFKAAVVDKYQVVWVTKNGGYATESSVHATKWGAIADVERRLRYHQGHRASADTGGNYRR